MKFTGLKVEFESSVLLAKYACSYVYSNRRYAQPINESQAFFSTYIVIIRKNKV